MTRRILIAVDPDRPEPQVVETGAALAATAGATLTLVGVLTAPATDPVVAGDVAFATEAATAALEGVAAAAGDVPVDLRAVVSASPARALHRLAREGEFSLIVAGAGRHRRLGRVGSVASRLLHGSPCPVLIVPARRLGRGQRIRRIGAAFVPEPDGCAAVEAAAALAGALDAELEVIAALPLVAWNDVGAPPMVVLGTPGRDEIHQRRHDDLQRATDRAVAGAAPGATVRIEDGDPATVLADASRDLDLLVCGSRGHGALAGLVLGSVSRRLVHEAACPVLVVPRDPADELAAVGSARRASSRR